MIGFLLWKIKMGFAGIVVRLKHEYKYIYPIIFLIMLIPSLAYSADVCVGPSATGNGSGADWDNQIAYSSIDGAGATRGNTYYLADGSYGSATFNTAESSTTYIYIKKATVASHGPAGGWLDSMGDGQAVFTDWTFSRSYYDIDGQVGSVSDIFTGYIAHGIVVGREQTGDNQHVVSIGSSGNPKNYILIKHTEIKNTNTPFTGTWYKSGMGIRGYGDYWTIQNSWVHDIGSVCLLSIGGDYGTIDNSVFARNGQAQVAMGWSDPTDHSETIMLQPGASYWTIKHSYFYDWCSTGMLILYDGNIDTIFTGNIVFQTGYYGSSCGNADGIIGGLSGTNTNTKIINNTFANIVYGGHIDSLGASYTGFQLQNNLFYNVKMLTTVNIGLPTANTYRDYNWYYDVGTFTAETNQQVGAGDPFVDNTNYDFRLSSGTNAGAEWASPYDTDLLGVARGSDSVWDRGAYEFDSGAADTTPAAFSFTDNTGVALGSTGNSDNVTLTGFDNTTTLVLTGDASCKYSINGAAWATADDNVTVGDNVALQNVASSSYSTAVSCTLNLGGVTDTWSRTTLAAVSDPMAPRFKGASMSGGWR